MNLRDYTLALTSSGLEVGIMVYYESRRLSGELLASGVGEISSVGTHCLNIHCPETWELVSVFRTGTDYNHDVVIPLGWKYDVT